MGRGQVGQDSRLEVAGAAVWKNVQHGVCPWCESSKAGKCSFHGGPSKIEKQRERGREYQRRRRARIVEENQQEWKEALPKAIERGKLDRERDLRWEQHVGRRRLPGEPPPWFK